MSDQADVSERVYRFVSELYSKYSLKSNGAPKPQYLVHSLRAGLAEVAYTRGLPVHKLRELISVIDELCVMKQNVGTEELRYHFIRNLHDRYSERKAGVARPMPFRESLRAMMAEANEFTIPCEKLFTLITCIDGICEAFANPRKPGVYTTTWS